MSEIQIENAIFVCFGGMSNVGALTGLAALEAVEQFQPSQASIFCLGGLPTEAPLVLKKTKAAKRIITVDGCPLNCAKKIVEAAGFTPTQALTLTEDCGIQKGPLGFRSDSDQKVIVDAILRTIKVNHRVDE